MPKHVKSGRRTWKDIEKKETHLPGDPNSGEPGSVPGRGTRSHRPQPGVHTPQERSHLLQLRSGAATETTVFLS